jgi:hypothetical protein
MTRCYVCGAHPFDSCQAIDGEIAECPRPPSSARQHITDGRPCWCEPTIEYRDPDTDAAVIVHKEPM